MTFCICLIPRLIFFIMFYYYIIRVYIKEKHRCRRCTTLITRKLLRSLWIDQEWRPFISLLFFVKRASERAAIRAGSKMGSIELCDFYFCCASIFCQPMNKFEFSGPSSATRQRHFKTSRTGDENVCNIIIKFPYHARSDWLKQSALSEIRERADNIKLAFKFLLQNLDKCYPIINIPCATQTKSIKTSYLSAVKWLIETIVDNSSAKTVRK